MRNTKKGMKRFAITAATTSLVVSVVSPVGAATVTFTDVPKTDSHYANILGAVERGLIKGYSDGTYKPAADFSRGQMAKALANHIVNRENLTYDGYIQKYGVMKNVKPFNDVQATYNDQELFKASLIVKHAGVFAGSNNNLLPNQGIVRQQMAKVLVNAFNLKDVPGKMSKVTDNTTALAEYVPYINILSKNGVTVVNDFRPNETVKRSQMASFLIRAYDVEKNAKVPADTLTLGADKVIIERINGQNVITVNYATEMTGSATVLANYIIEGVLLTDAKYAGAKAVFSDATKKVVKITLPSGKFLNENESKKIEFSQNIKTADGRTVQTADKKVLTISKQFKDDTGPQLDKAEFVVASSTATTSKVLQLTFNENVKINKTHMDKDIVVNVGSEQLKGTLTDGQFTDPANNPVLLYVLDKEVTVTKAGTVTVPNEGTNNPVMGILDVYENKATGTTVNLTDTVINPGITDQAADGPVFVHTSDTNKNTSLFSNPVAASLTDLSKTSGGVLGLDIGILDAGLLSSTQINKIDNNNRHSITIGKGKTLDATATVAIHSVLGGHSFNIHVMKENADGNYATIATYKGSSGGALGIANTVKTDLGTLEEGKYEIILAVAEGLSVVQVIPFNLVNLVEKDYTGTSVVTGNLLKGQYLGENSTAIVSAIRGTQETTVENNETIVQGKYGQLSVKQDGTYKYIPSSIRSNIGNVEVFEYTIKNTSNNMITKGSLEISLQE